MKLIDKDKVVAEIEKRKSELQLRIAELGNFESNTLGLFQEVDLYDDILSFLNTLEVKEEVLDRNDKTKLMRKCVKTAYKRGYDMGVLQTTNKINHNTKEVDLEKEFDNYTKDILACDVQFEPFTHLYNCAKYFYELGLKAKGE